MVFVEILKDTRSFVKPIRVSLALGEEIHAYPKVDVLWIIERLEENVEVPNPMPTESRCI